MGKLIYSLLMSLDGYTEDADGRFDWATPEGEQMEALFDYITSNQFAQRIRAVVENYETMRSDLDKEKAAMQRLWKKRETQIGRISDQMLAVCGELQGISAASLPMLDSIAGLEFSLDSD